MTPIKYLWIACFVTLTGTFAASARANDPVEQLRQVLTPKADNLQVLATRPQRIAALVKELHTISQLRRAYFLTGWSAVTVVDPNTKKETPNANHIKVGEDLDRKIREAKQQAETNRTSPDPAVRQAAQVKLLAIAMLVAEIAENEPVTDAKKTKFARRLTDVAVALAEDKTASIGITQTALHALGKITPPPAEAIKVLQARVKSKGEVGPRQVAAYALIDLVKNANYLTPSEQLQTVTGVIETARWGVEDVDAEESIRGHCLVSIRDAAKSLGDTIRNIAPPEVMLLDLKLRAELRAELRTALLTCQAISPTLGKTMRDGRSTANIRLATLDALTQLAQLRAQVLPYIPIDKADAGAFQAHDPLGKLGDRVNEVAALLAREADVRERRAAITILDLLGTSSREALPQITKAMSDPDGLVRYTAARLIRHFPYQDDKSPSPVPTATIVALGTLLLDPDPDINSAAAESLEVLGPQAEAAIESLSSAVTIGDVENRVEALKIVGNLGTPIAIKAYPAVIAGLTDADARITRRAAETLGQFGAIASKKHATTDASLLELLDSFRAAALPALTKALRDADPETRLNASEAILSIGTPKKGL